MTGTAKQALHIKVLSWPTPQEYNEAVQNAAASFSDADLKSGQPVHTALGLPRPITGAFASVYRMHSGSHDWAVRCFLYNVADQHERYAKISAQLSQSHLPYTVPFDFLEEGIKLHGQWYPILKMQWADGQHLNEFVERNIQNPNVLAEYSEKWEMMMQRLRAAGIAHGDLQHGNVLVDNRDFKLVDYDGMYVPELAGLTSNELGHRNYQHPARSKDAFGPYLDNFSSWVVYVSMQCVRIGPELWGQLGGGDECMLFRQADFVDPLNSRVFATLENHYSGEVRMLARTLRYFLSLPVKDVPDLENAPPEPTHLPALHSTPFPPGRMMGGNGAGASGSGTAGAIPDWMHSVLGESSAKHGAGSKVAGYGEQSWERCHLAGFSMVGMPRRSRLEAGAPGKRSNMPVNNQFASKQENGFGAKPFPNWHHRLRCPLL